MVYQINNLTVQFGGDTILDNVQFEIKNKNEKIAVVGRNGSGKTTLLRFITGEVEKTSIDGVESSVLVAGDTCIGYLKQLSFEDDTITLDEEMRKVFSPIIRMQERLDELVDIMSSGEYSDQETYNAIIRNDGYADNKLPAYLSGDDLKKCKDHDEIVEEYTQLQEKFREHSGYYYEKEYDMLLKRFGFTEDDKQKSLSCFSGGQRTKLAFIKLLLSKPDILLLDEPTNHLDISTIEWLERYLKAYNKAVVVVSHDRMFLDKIVDTVYEIEHGKIKRYNGNYSDFVKLKKEAYDKQLKNHKAQQKEIERLNKVAERFMGKPTKVSMAKSKLKAIEHMDIVEAPDRYDDKAFKAEFTPRIESGKDVLYVKDLAIGYDKVLSELSFDIKRGDRLGIIGGNGIGKSTLLKTLVNDLNKLGGEFSYGVNVEIGYFDQQMAQYVSEKTVMEDFWDEYPHLTQTEVRNSLGALLFTGDDVFKEVKMLSGGEKVRLALAKIFKKKPNMLILDEPTNHMDIVGKETLESMLLNYPGTVIFVSHDRYFVKKVATRVLFMDEDKVKLYNWGYAQYEEERISQMEDFNAFESITKGKIISNNYKSEATETVDKNVMTEAQQSYLAGKEAAKQERKLKKLEEKIEKLEGDIESRRSELAAPENASDYLKLQEIQSQIDILEEELLKTMEEWDEG
ncbi:MAG: ABC-F family ATP-binding cassette domain-containing protein [Lachnospiraceae bacterium]|nr:ABC-F family ATP-binding cassette domain-containing protein [Lachnospiraceae bacterium]